MSQVLPIPQYRDSLLDFIASLRTAYFSEPYDIAEIVGIETASIMRYEIGSLVPPIGYLAVLAQEFVKRQDVHFSQDERQVYQQRLLAQMNKAILNYYGFGFQFESWDDLVQISIQNKLSEIPKLHAKRIPEFRDNIARFFMELREATFQTQDGIAQFFGMRDYASIGHYERGYSKPKIGYIVVLAREFVEQQHLEFTSHDHYMYQQRVIEEVNKAVATYKNEPTKKFESWDDLVLVADEFINDLSVKIRKTVDKATADSQESASKVSESENSQKSNSHTKQSLEIPPEYKQPFISMMSYFGNVVEKKYPDIDVGITIEQTGTTITLVISTPEGEKETIEQELTEYSLVIQGKRPIETYFDEPLAVLELKQKIEMTQLELRQAQQLRQIERDGYHARVDSLERQVQWMGSLIEKNSMSQSQLLESIRELSQHANANTEHSFDTILEILERGVTVADEEAFRASMSEIERHDRTLFGKLMGLINAPIQGVAGNYLYQFLLDVGMRLP